MSEPVISTFKGLNPKKEDATQGIVLPAKVASDVDLRNGVLKPVRSNTLVANGHSGEFIKVDDDWLSGKQYYSVYFLRGFNIIVYKDGDKWRRIARAPRTIAGLPNNAVDLGVPVPSAPKVTDLPHSVQVLSPESLSEILQYESAYALSWVRKVDDFVDESGLSEFSFYKSRYIKWKIERPLSVPDGVIGWKIYRLDRGYRAGTAFKLVAEKSIGDVHHDDYKNYESLTDVPDGLFEDDGVTISRTSPVVDFDGISATPYYNYFVAWKDNTFYLSEPNNIDSFPQQYQTSIETKIISIVPQQSDMYIFTDKGVLRAMGQDPFTLRVLPDYIGDRIASPRAVFQCELGLFYATKTGLNRVVGGQVEYISRVPLGDEYFKGIDASSIHFNYVDGIVFMFHNQGTLMFIPESGIGFVTLNGVYDGSFYDRKAGTLYVTRYGNIESLFTGDGKENMVYETGDLTLNEPSDKYFEKVEFFGEGKVTVNIFLDNEVNASTELEMDLDGMDRQRILHYPRGYTGRSGRYRVTGKGTVKEIKFYLYRS